MKWNNLPYLGQYLAQRLEEHKAYVNLGWSIYKGYKRNKETKEINLSTLGEISSGDEVALHLALSKAEKAKEEVATARYHITNRRSILALFKKNGYKLLPLVHDARAIERDPLEKYLFWLYKGNHSFLLTDNYNGKESVVLRYAYLTNANFRVRFSEPITWHQCARIPHLHTNAELIYDIIDESIAHHESFYDQVKSMVAHHHLGLDDYDEIQDQLIKLRLEYGEIPISMYRRFARKLQDTTQGTVAYMRMRDALYMPFSIGKNKYKRPVWGDLMQYDEKFIKTLMRYYP